VYFRLQQLKTGTSRGYGDFKLTGSGYPKFTGPLTAKLCVRPQKFQRRKNVLEILYHRAKFGGARISPAAGATKNVEFFCLSITLLNVRDCAPDFAMKALEYRNDFGAVGQGKVCSCAHSCSTFSDCCQLKTPLNAKVQKRQN